MKTDTKPEELKDLINQAIKGDLALPEFQRDFVWKPELVKLLISSVAQDWPIGSFLIWEPAKIDLAIKKFEGLPDPSPEKVKKLVLDGQQRLTGLIHAFEDDYSDVTYFVRDLPTLLLEVSQSGDPYDIDEHLDHLASGKFKERYGNIEVRSRAGVALVSELANNARFVKWAGMYVSSYKDTALEDLFDARDVRLPGLLDYGVPCVTIGETLELPAVARIFETTNKTGIKLSTVDLMIARLHPSGFRLRDRWEQQLLEHADLMHPYDNELDAEDILRLLAFWQPTGGGITRAPILRLRGEFVEANWTRAGSAFAGALEFLRDRCGVVDKTLLPARVMVLPVAIALDHAEESNIGAHRQSVLRTTLAKWFWWSAIRDRYRRSTNTRALQDARAFVAWVNDETQRPEFLNDIEDVLVDTGRFNGERVALEDRLREGRRGEAALEATVLALINKRGAQDLAGTLMEGGERDPVAKSAGDIQSHHLFPRKGGQVAGWSRIDTIANLTPQSGRSNKQMDNTMPNALALTANDRHAHLLEAADMNVDDEAAFHAFVDARAANIAAAMFDELGA